MIYKFLNEEVEIDENFCFVIMPYKKTMKPVFVDGILPAVRAMGMRCERADQNLESIPIMFQVYDQIRRAKLVIADISTANPNVYYELGICHALKPQVVLLLVKGDKVPFDLQNIRYLEYEDDQEGLKKLGENLQRTIKEILSKPETFGKGYAEEIRILKKAFDVWEKSGEVILRFEEFLQIVLALEKLELSEHESAFLGFCAAYFGKFMKILASHVGQNASAIKILVKEAASGAMTRVPWRAAAMLEQCNPDMVRAEIEAYQGRILNGNIFPDAIYQRSTLSILKQVSDDETISRELTDKLSEVVRQIESEFHSVS